MRSYNEARSLNWYGSLQCLNQMQYINVVVAIITMEWFHEIFKCHNDHSKLMNGFCENYHPHRFQRIVEKSFWNLISDTYHSMYHTLNIDSIRMFNNLFLNPICKFINTFDWFSSEYFATRSDHNWQSLATNHLTNCDWTSQDWI